MLRRYWNQLAVLGGATALLAVVGATPASAAMTSCPSGTPAYFTGSAVYLGQEGQTNIWSTPIDLYAYCGAIDSDHALAGVSVTGVIASSNGTIPDLMGSADGSTPSIVLPVATVPGLPYPGANLPVPAGLTTDANGKVSFTLRATSPTHPNLAGVNGATQLIGLQLDYGAGTGVSSDGTSYQIPVGGEGGIFASTPELDSLFLFGSGAMGLAGYGLMRLRARRRD